MDNMTLTHPIATWRSVEPRLRFRLHSCSTAMGNVIGVKPATSVTNFGTNPPTRRGVPAQ